MKSELARLCDALCGRRRSGVSRHFTVLGFVLFFAGSSHAAQITWYSATTSGGSDEPFISLLQGAGHVVTRVPSIAGNLSDDQINQLNATDLLIVGRATASGDFDDATDQTNWNQRVTTRMMMMSAFMTRASRLGWQTGETVTDAGPTPLTATNPNHPVFAGVTLNGNTTADNYNIQIDRGTSMIGNSLAPGGIVIATHSTNPNAIAIAEFPAGTTVTADGLPYTLAANRYYFAGGSREVDMGALTSAGQYDLTTDGGRMFLNFVNYAVVPEPSACGLLALAGALGLRRAKRE